MFCELLSSTLIVRRQRTSGLQCQLISFPAFPLPLLITSLMSFIIPLVFFIISLVLFIIPLQLLIMAFLSYIIPLESFIIQLFLTHLFFMFSCLSGYQCPSVTGVSQVACSAGYYSIGSQSACTACPAGYSCALTTSSLAVICAKGYYATGGFQSCVKCPGGYQCGYAHLLTTAC